MTAIECLRNLRIICPGHQSNECCLNNEDNVMSEGKIKLSEGTPEEIAAYKKAFEMVHSPDWEKNSIPNDLGKDRYLKQAQALANGNARIEIAIGLWHHFAPESSIEWSDDAHKAEYLRAVDDITTGQLFNLLVNRLNYDGSDTASLTLGEIARATEGAVLGR